MRVIFNFQLAFFGLLISPLSGVVRCLDLPATGGLANTAGGGGLDKPLPGVGGAGELSHRDTGTRYIQVVLTFRQEVWERPFRVLVLIKSSILTWTIKRYAISRDKWPYDAKVSRKESSSNDYEQKLVGVGGQQGEAKIDVLAAKRAKENNSTAEEEKQKIKDNQKNEKNTKQKAEEDLVAGRLNSFYAYGMQSVGQNVRPKWVLVFENAFTAHAYFGQVMQDYQEYYKKSRENSNDPRMWNRISW
jgi:hypothetical protein